MKAIGLNFADVFSCLGLYSATPRGSFIPGLEFAGVVEAVGSPGRATVTPSGGCRPGDHVVGLVRFGAYASAVNVRTSDLRALRPGWRFAEGAAYRVQALTAWYGLVRLAAVERGDIVLVQSAAGGVGLNALAILSALGARPIAVVGAARKREWLAEHRGLAREQIVVRDRRTFSADLDCALAAAGASGFDCVFDAVAGPYFTPAYDRLRPEGRMVIYGAADYMPRGSRPDYLRLVPRYLFRPRVDPLAMIAQNRSVMGFNLIWLWDRSGDLASSCDALDAVIAAPPLVGRIFPFAEAPAALRHLQGGTSIGKVVLEV